ncbi:MAG: hypothetical protein M3R57_01760 [Chloroflexota bacterium]|nr:hypothetical protein [Chloroflexota bacterium]
MKASAPLDRFWERLERLRVEDMLALAARPLDERAHADAMERARAAAEGARLGDDVADARAAIDSWVVSLFNRSTAQPGWFEANWGRPGSVADRANLAASLGEVATALILGDRLTEEDRDELLGAWVDIAG